MSRENDDQQNQAERDIDRCTKIVRELPGLMARAWNADTTTLTQRQAAVDDSGSGSGGKPGSRAPMRLDLMGHVQTTLDEARTLADDLGVFLAGDRGEEALQRLPALLEATLDDCRTCDRCLTDQGVCACRHRTVTKRVGQLASTLRTALGDQEPRHDLQGGECPDCGSGQVSVRGTRVWCRADGCGFDRRGGDFGIGVLSVTG